MSHAHSVRFMEGKDSITIASFASLQFAWHMQEQQYKRLSCVQSELLKANGQWRLITCITRVEIGIKPPLKKNGASSHGDCSLEILAVAANQQIGEMAESHTGCIPSMVYMPGHVDGCL